MSKRIRLMSSNDLYRCLPDEFPEAFRNGGFGPQGYAELYMKRFPKEYYTLEDFGHAHKIAVQDSNGDMDIKTKSQRYRTSNDGTRRTMKRFSLYDPSVGSLYDGIASDND